MSRAAAARVRRCTRRVKLGARRARAGALLQHAPVEVVVELRKVAATRGSNQSHDVIGEQGHQSGHDRQVRALLFEVSCASTIPAAYGITMTIRELFRYSTRPRKIRRTATVVSGKSLNTP